MTQQNISRMADAWRTISRTQAIQADRDKATRMALQQCGEYLIAIHDMAEVEQRRYEFLANRPVIRGISVAAHEFVNSSSSATGTTISSLSSQKDRGGTKFLAITCRAMVSFRITNRHLPLHMTGKNQSFWPQRRALP